MMSFNSYLAQLIPNYVYSVYQAGNSSYHYVGTNIQYLTRVLIFFYLHHNTQNKLFSDLVAADFPEKKNRFQLVYNVLSLTYHQRLFLFSWLNELQNAESITSFYPAASWYEREAWDLFGIHFSNNIDLRRILTDYGFQGHPLRKDFPLSGFIELFYNSKIDAIVYREINLVQEYRTFDVSTPWQYLS